MIQYVEWIQRSSMYKESQTGKDGVAVLSRRDILKHKRAHTFFVFAPGVAQRLLQIYVSPLPRHFN